MYICINSDCIVYFQKFHSSYVVVTLCVEEGVVAPRDFLLQLVYLEMRLNRGGHFS